MKHESKPIRWDVFIPCFIVIGGAALLGIVNNAWLTNVTYAMFDWSLSTFGWLYQIVAMVTLLLACLLMFTRVGKIRFGGPEAKAKHSFGSWFAMTLTGGIATGLITYGVNEVLIYYGNIYGELEGYGIQPLTQEAELFAMGRCFYNWTFIPYAMYALSGVLIAYMYFNRKKQLSVAASLTPIFGEKVTHGIWVVLVDVLSVLAIALGLASSLGAGLALIGSGLYSAYGVEQGPIVWMALTAIITVTFTIASVTGIDKGIKWLAGLTSKIFYVLLILLFIIGPTIYILNMANVGLGYWLDRFWMWGFDPYTVGGSALVTWWTMYDWAIWIAYAPLMGIFFAIIAYGRTVRQFLIVNWILPASFGFVWFSVWGSTAMESPRLFRLCVVLRVGLHRPGVAEERQRRHHHRHSERRRYHWPVGVPEERPSGHDYHPCYHSGPHRGLLHHGGHYVHHHRRSVYQRCPSRRGACHLAKNRLGCVHRRDRLRHGSLWRRRPGRRRRKVSGGLRRLCGAYCIYIPSSRSFQGVLLRSRDQERHCRQRGSGRSVIFL